MWQELRDQADYAFRSADNYEQRKSAMYIAMLGNESGNLLVWAVINNYWGRVGA